MSIIMLDILQAMQNRASQILIANGYYTDAGASIYRGRQHFDARINPETGITYDPFPMISIRAVSLTASDTPGRSKARPEHKRPMSIQIEVKGALIAGVNNPQDAALELLSDIWRAINLDSPGNAIDPLTPGDSLLGEPDPETAVLVVSQTYSTVFFQNFGEY